MRGAAPDPQAGAVAVGERRPAHLGAVAVLLRHHVRGLQLVDGARSARRGRRRGVGVGLARAEPEPLEPLEPAGSAMPQAEPRQRERPLALGLDVEPQASPSLGGPA